jgi:nucleotide-binding universal stress UspA family protein
MNLLLNKLLVAVDFSKCSQKALHYAAGWSLRYKSEICLLHVMNDVIPLNDILQQSQADELNKTIEQNLRDFIKDIFDERTPVEILVEKGKVYQKITETANSRNAGIIFIGSNGSSDKHSNYLGSNTMRTMRTCNLPVMVVSQNSKNEPVENIVFPVDLSKDFFKKLLWADTFKVLNKDIRIHLISVLKDHDEFNVNRMALQLSNAKEELEKLGVKHTAEMIKCGISNDSISEVVADYSEKLEADMIFILTQAESSYTPFYVSSLLQEIIALAKVPVMAINPVPVSNSRDKIKI